MGGRGAASGHEYQRDGREYNYGDEYGSIHTFGNIKFVYNKQNVSVTAPIENMTENRIYVTLGREIDKKTAIITLKEPKYITFFKEARKERFNMILTGIGMDRKKN